MRLVIKYFTLWVLLVFSCCACAALDLELTQGIDQAVPIAIVPFVNGTSISSVVSSDLQNTGRFQLFDVHGANESLADFSKVNFSYWRHEKVNDLVVGTVTPQGGKYKVNIQLVDIYGKSILFNKQFVIGKTDFRLLAHQISDLIYKQLTGVAGIFSTKIAFVLIQRGEKKPGSYSLIVSDVDGFNAKALLVSTQPIMSPAWSPDGKKIAYVSFENQRAAIYVQNVATGKRIVLTSFSGINGAPAWSPDGAKIALVLSKTEYPKIYIYSLATNHITMVTSGYSLDTEPAWSPDSKSIIFTSNRGGTPQIYRLYLDSGKINRVTFEGNYNARASFAPDGNKIVMLHEEDGMFNIAIQDLTSGRIDLLTQLGMDESPSMAPNGQMIVYATNYARMGVLAEVSIDGKIKLRLPAQEGEVQESAWSPFFDN